MTSKNNRQPETDKSGNPTAAVKSALQEHENPEKSEHHYGFFKAFPGGYGEGDKFLGITVPNQRKIAQQFYRDIDLPGIEELLNDRIHEYRLTALFMLVLKFQRGTEEEQKEIARFYLDHLDRVNNWDLVDSSAEKILGPYLYHHGGSDRGVLYRLAESEDLWRQRVAMIACYYFIKQSEFTDAAKIAELLVGHPHDLIHKAVGWMLREIGKRDKAVETEFLKKHAASMPRTMLRYAIEKFPSEEREYWLALTRRSRG